MQLIYDEVKSELGKKNAKSVVATLEWMLTRCILELGLEECFEGNELKEDVGKDIMMSFIDTVICQNAEKENLDEVIDILKSKTDLQDKFIEFMQKGYSKQFGNIDERERWKGHEKIFVELLSDYRAMGTIDKKIKSKLLDFAKNINNDPLRYIYELIQNADDCEYEKGAKKSITIEISEDCGSMMVSYPEKGMTYSDIIAITTIDQSNKLKKKKRKVIGEKGIGFKTIFSVCESADIHSGNYHFKLSDDSFEPAWIEGEDKEGTQLKLYFKDEISSETEKENADDKKNKLRDKEIYGQIIEKYGVKNEKISAENIIKNCPIFFTNNIEEIIIKKGSNELKIKRAILNDEMRVEYFIDGASEPDIKLIFDIFKKDIIFTWEEYKSRYDKVYGDEKEYSEENAELKKYPIVLLAVKKVEIKGEETDIKNEIKTGNIFSYLPTYTAIKVPFAIQIPFELNQDRSCMELDENSDTNLWNKRLFREAFISEKNNDSLIKMAFYKLRQGESINIFDYLPNYENNNHDFFKSPDVKYDDNIKRINNYCKKNDEKNIIFEEFKNMKILKKLYEDGYCAVTDNPILYKKNITEILSEKETDITRGENVVGYIDLGKYKNAEAMGLKYKEIEGKENFANHLIELNRDKFIKNFNDLMDELTGVDKQNLKLIAIKNEGKYLSISDGEIWIKVQGESDAISKNKLKVLDISENSNDKVYELLNEEFNNILEMDDIDELSEKIWKKIYDKNEEKANCSYELFKEIMELLYKVSKESYEEGWFGYTKEFINKNEGIGKKIIKLWNDEEFVKKAKEEVKP